MLIRIKNGNIVNKEEYFDYMLTLKDGEYILKEYKRTRTNDQNNYYWGLIDIIAKHIGEDKDYIHGVLGMKFLVDNSKKAPYIKSTTKLTTIEFSEYIENIKNFVSQYGIVLPSADEFENFIK